MYDRLYSKLETMLREMERKEKLSASDIQMIDWTSHAMKSLLCVEEKSGGYSENSYRGEGSYRGDNSYKRDSMGRYSRKDDYIETLRSMAEDAPDERTRQNMHRMVREMERA